MLDILLIITLVAIYIITYKIIGEWAIAKVKAKETIYQIGFITAILLSIFTDIIFDLIK